jgi:ankyrin repeat protein
MLDDINCSWLHLAAKNGYSEELDNLLNAIKEEKNGSLMINQKDIYGKTSIHLATLVGHLQIVQSLLKAGADINIADKEGFTPIESATCNRYYEIFKILYDYSISHNLHINIDKLIFIAAKNSNENILSFLIAHAVNPNIKDKDGYTPLDYALKNKDTTSAKIILNYNAKKMDSSCPAELKTLAYNLLYAIENAKDIKDIQACIRYMDSLSEKLKHTSTSIIDEKLHIRPTTTKDLKKNINAESETSAVNNQEKIITDKATNTQLEKEEKPHPKFTG